MKLSPHYNAIKSRALEMLRGGQINNHSIEEIETWRSDDRWVAHNTIGVALCMARDEIQNDHHAAIKQAWQDPSKPTIAEIRAFNREAHFTKGNHRKAEAEIIRELCPDLRKYPAHWRGKSTEPSLNLRRL